MNSVIVRIHRSDGPSLERFAVTVRHDVSPRRALNFPVGGSPGTRTVFRVGKERMSYMKAKEMAGAIAESYNALGSGVPILSYRVELVDDEAKYQKDQQEKLAAEQEKLAAEMKAVNREKKILAEVQRRIDSAVEAHSTKIRIILGRKCLLSHEVAHMRSFLTEKILASRPEIEAQIDREIEREEREDAAKRLAKARSEDKTERVLNRIFGEKQ